MCALRKECAFRVTEREVVHVHLSSDTGGTGSFLRAGLSAHAKEGLAMTAMLTKDCAPSVPSFLPFPDDADDGVVVLDSIPASEVSVSVARRVAAWW